MTASVQAFGHRALSGVTKSKGALSDALLYVAGGEHLSRFPLSHDLLKRDEDLRCRFDLLVQRAREPFAALHAVEGCAGEQSARLFQFVLDRVEPVRVGDARVVQGLPEPLAPEAFLRRLRLGEQAVNALGHTDHLKPPTREPVTRSAYASRVTKSRRLAWT